MEQIKTNEKNFRENITLKNKILIKNLEKEISNNFWLEKKEIEFFIKNESLNSREQLKIEFQNKNKNFWNTKIEELFDKLGEIKKLQEFTKNETFELKNEVEKQLEDNFHNPLEKYLSRKMINIARRPEKPHEHILWATLWIANSLISISESIFKLGLWIIKSPYDLYLILSWKWELENIKKI